MSTPKTLELLRSRIAAHYTLIFLITPEEERWESELSNLLLDMRYGLVTWSMTAGYQPPARNSDAKPSTPQQVLDQVPLYPKDHVILLKDFHPHLSDPSVVRKFRDLAEGLRLENKVVLLMSPAFQVPRELEHDSITMELPMPEVEDLHLSMDEVLSDYRQRTGIKLIVDEEERDKMLKTLLGLTQREVERALARSIQGKDKIDEDVYANLVSEKKAMLRGSELLEYYDLQEGLLDIGGMDGLKDWLRTRSSAYSEKARRQGLPIPKGMLLLGVQGCGKSLTARVAARLLSFPLVRLDIAGLLSSDQGSSEKNMRTALKTVESIAPVVLWMDEIEKGFSGLESRGGSVDGTLNRLFGTFLTWMQEHGKAIFVVATANSVSQLPPEMLRRGRFDELFFVNLPNYHERKDISTIHMRKRGLNPKEFDIELLAKRTEGYSGAELEQVVISALYEAYTHGRKVTPTDLMDAQELTVPLSVTMEEKIFQLREWARGRCRPATPDSRVLQMLEEEAREAKS